MFSVDSKNMIFVKKLENKAWKTVKIISININFISILKAKTKGEVWEIGGQSLSLWGEWTAWKIAYMGKIEKGFV